MRVEFNSEAEYELEVAFGYYEAQAPGVGDQFLAEVNRTLELLSTHPEVGVIVPPNLRRLVLRRFPFVLYYNWDQERLRIQVVAHQQRRLGYWRTRRP